MGLLVELTGDFVTFGYSLCSAGDLFPQHPGRRAERGTGLRERRVVKSRRPSSCYKSCPRLVCVIFVQLEESLEIA